MSPHSTSFSRDDRYELLAYEYLQILAAMLSTALQSNGVVDSETRHAICADFLFDLGVMLDEEPIRVESLTAYPLLCFSERFLNVDTDANDLGAVFAPSTSFSFHEHVHAAVADTLGERCVAGNSQSSGPTDEELQKIAGWLKSPCTVAEAEMYCSQRDARGDFCLLPPGTWQGLLQVEVLANARPDDALWWYQADSEAWAEQRGSMGIALVRDGRVAAFMQTGRS